MYKYTYLSVIHILHMRKHIYICMLHASFILGYQPMGATDSSPSDLSLSLSLSLSHTHTHTYVHTHTLPFIFSLSHPLVLTHTRPRSLSHTYAHAHKLVCWDTSKRMCKAASIAVFFLSPPLFILLSLAFFLSLSFSHGQTHTCIGILPYERKGSKGCCVPRTGYVNVATLPCGVYVHTYIYIVYTYSCTRSTNMHMLH